jgi:hypothetical protein
MTPVNDIETPALAETDRATVGTGESAISVLSSAWS